MKKLICSVITGIAILAVAAPVFCQDAPDVSSEKNVLKVNTLSLIIGTGSVFYERKLSEITSAQLGVGYLNYKIGDTKFDGLILTPEARFYVKKEAIDGFYVAPYLRYNKFNFKGANNSGEGSLSSLGGGVAFGMQWIYPKGFVMDLFFGGHYTGANVKTSSGSQPTDITKIDGFKTRVGFSLGFAF